MMNKIFSILGSLFIFTGFAFADGDTLWTRTYGTDNDEEWANCVEQTPDGGYIMVGVFLNMTTFNKDIWVIRTDSLGTSIWTKKYGGSGFEDGASICRAQDNTGYVIVGWTNSYGAGGSDMWVIKIDSVGKTMWSKTYGGGGSDCGNWVERTNDGGYIIAGEKTATNTDVWLLKINSEGNKLWDTTYGGIGNDYGESVQQTSDGGYIITGKTTSSGAGMEDIWLIKTDSAGTVLWDTTYGGSANDHGKCVRQTNDGGYIIVGQTKSYGAGQGDVWLLKTDSLGNILWDMTCGDTTQDAGDYVQQTSDGGYIITGTTYPALLNNLWIIKTDSTGNKTWDISYGKVLDGEWGYCVKETAPGYYIVAGGTHSFETDHWNALLIRVFDEQGVEENPKFKVQSSKMEVYPNPFTSKTVISYRLSVTSENLEPITDYRLLITLSIYDISGKLIKSFNPEASIKHPVPPYPPPWRGAVAVISSIIWDRKDNSGKEVSNGIYFCRLVSGNHTETKKIIAIK